MDVAVLRSSSSARLAVGLAAAACALAVPVAQEGAAYKSAVVALSDDPQLRVAFEEGAVIEQAPVEAIAGRLAAALGRLRPAA